VSFIFCGRSLVDNSTAEQTDNTHGGAGHWLSPLGCKPDALRLWRFESAPHHRALAGAPGTATADLRSSRDRVRRYERRGRGSSPRGGAAGTRAARRRHGCEGDGQPIRFGSGRHRVRLAGIRRRLPRAATQPDARWSTRHGHRTLNPETEVRILDGQHGPRGGTEDARGSDPRAHTGMQVQLLPGARMILEGWPPGCYPVVRDRRSRRAFDPRALRAHEVEHGGLCSALMRRRIRFDS
jgi:hypothetical protein